MTAKQFCELNPDLPKSQNMRDLGTTLPRSIPSGKTALEFLNSKLISEGASRAIREKELRLQKDRQVAVFNKKRKKRTKKIV